MYTKMNLSFAKLFDKNKYERMKKLGIPMSSIENQMKKDGCPSSMIKIFNRSSILNQQRHSFVSTEDSKEEDNILGIIPITKRLKSFHWAKLSKVQSENTIFSGMDEMLSDVKLDYKNIEQLFANHSTSPHASIKQYSSKRERFMFIDTSLSMIGLAQLKMTEDELLDAILTMDDKVMYFSCQIFL